MNSPKKNNSPGKKPGTNMDNHGNANGMMCHGGVCQVVRVRQQFAAEIRMVEGRPFWDEEPGKIM